MTLRNSRGMQRTALLMLFCGALCACQCGSIGGDVRSVARESQCRSNLRKLYESLHLHMSEQGDVPRKQDGIASLDGLVDLNASNTTGVASAALRCPADQSHNGGSYILNPFVSIDDFGPDSSVVVAFDRIPQHVSPTTGNLTSNVLLGNGSIVTMDLSLVDQQEWRQLVAAGDECACRVSSRDGVSRNWTSGEILWYIGPRRGYVSNR